MNIILFVAPGILGPNMVASLCHRGREKIAYLVLPLKKHALSNDDLLTIAHYARVPYLAPADLRDRDFIEKIRSAQPDVLLVASYDTKIPQELLEIPKIAAVNIHPSLLPSYRGACPEFWAIRNGDLKTGVTLHDLTERFDDGDIIMQREIRILPHDTLGTLLYKISALAFEVVAQFLDSLHKGERLPRRKQNNAEATRAPLVVAEDLRINWKDKSSSINDLIRAANPLGGAWTLFRGFHLKVWHADIIDLPEIDKKYDEANPGTLIPCPDLHKLLIKAGDGLIELKTIQYALFYIIDGWSFAGQANVVDNEHVS
jgi:methionyl-tRNA formyltransferase